MKSAQTITPEMKWRLSIGDPNTPIGQLWGLNAKPTTISDFVRDAKLASEVYKGLPENLGVLAEWAHWNTPYNDNHDYGIFIWFVKIQKYWL